MASKRIAGLFISVTLVLGMFLTTYAATAFDINVNQEYLGLSGGPFIDNIVMRATTEVDTPLINFVRTDRDSYRYDLTGLVVAGTGGRSYTPEEVYTGATFNFPDEDYVINTFYNNPRPLNIITVLSGGNGTGAVNANPAAQGDTVVLTAAPNSGYMFSRWQVVSGGAIIADPASQSTSFIMPAVPVTVKAEFVPLPANSGDSSDELGYISVIGVPKGSVPTGNSFKLTTIPIDTFVDYDKTVLSMRENDDGSRTFTALKAGKTVITFSKRGYHDREVEIRIASQSAASDSVNENPGTGAPAHLAAITLAGLCCLMAAAVAGRGKRR